ncbi:hypothetical protein V6N13_103457 [Hibiscus sabdariffa]
MASNPEKKTKNQRKYVIKTAIVSIVDDSKPTVFEHTTGLLLDLIRQSGYWRNEKRVDLIAATPVMVNDGGLDPRQDSHNPIPIPDDDGLGDDSNCWGYVRGRD